MTDLKVLSRNVLAVGASAAGGQIVTFLSLPILTRLYPPDAIGGWALFVSTGLLIGSVSTLRYELAVVLPKRSRAAAALVTSALLIAVAVAAVSALLLPLIANLLIGPQAVARLGALLWLLPLLTLLSAVVQCCLFWCTRQATFGLYGAGQFLLPTVTAAAQIALAIGGLHESAGLVLGTIAGYGVVAAALSYSMFVNDRATIISAMSIRRMVTMMRRYPQYPRSMMPLTVLSTLRDRAAYFLLGRFGDASIVGFYTMAQRFTNIPNSFVSSAVRPVFFQHAARRGISTLGPAVVAIVAGILLVAVPNLVVFWFHAEFILKIVLGPQWGDTAPYAIVLSVPALPLLLGNWFDRSLDVMSRQALAFRMELVFSVAALAALLVGFALFGGIWPAIVAQSVVMTVYFSIWIAVVFRCAKFPSAAPVQLLGLALALIAGCAALLWSLEHLLPVSYGVGLYYAAYFAALAIVMPRLVRRLAGFLG